MIITGDSAGHSWTLLDAWVTSKYSLTSDSIEKRLRVKQVLSGLMSTVLAVLSGLVIRSTHLLLVCVQV
jgi:hypothetical protein